MGLAAAHSAQLLGAAVVFVGDLIPERLEQAKTFGCETIDVSKGDPKDQIEQILGVPEVDAAVDSVGFEARGHGKDADHEAPATVLNSIMDITRAGGKLGIPGLYVTGDPGAADDAAKEGSLSIRIGLGWAKSHSFTTGQCPVMRYNRGLMQAILHDKVQIAKAVNATVITLDDAPKGYQDFDKGAAKKFVIDPHGLVKALRVHEGEATSRPSGRGVALPVALPDRLVALRPAAWPAGRAERPRGRRRGAQQAQVDVDLRGPLRAGEDDLDAPLGGAHDRARIERGRRQAGQAEHRL